MRVMLFSPPNWTPTMPHLALPTLTAYLRLHGVEVIQRDLNLEVFDQVLTQKYLHHAVSLVRDRFTGGPARMDATTPPPERVRWALREGPRLASQVERAKSVIRSDAFSTGRLA